MVAFAIAITIVLIGMFSIMYCLATGKIETGQKYRKWSDMVDDGTVKPVYFVCAFNQAYMDGLKRFFGMLEYPKNHNRWGKDRRFLWDREQRKSDRTFGYYFLKHEAQEAVINNHCDIHETCFDYVCIDTVFQGIHGYAEDQEWYKFNHKTEMYELIERPKETLQIVNFGCG